MSKGKGYQLFDPLPAAWYARLKQSISEVGVLVPIVVDENGAVLDGHHRKLACAELHVDCPERVLTGLSEDDKKAFVITTNLMRRQLSGVEKAKFINDLRNLGWSSRRIAAAVGVHHTTVLRSGGASAPPDTPTPTEGSVTDGSASDGDSPVETTRDSGPSETEDESRSGSHREEPRPDPETDPAQQGASGGETAGSTSPASRVIGRDGKSHPAKRAPQFPRTDADDFKDRFWKEMEHTYKTLLTMNPQRVVEVAPLVDHKSLVDFARSLSAWALELQTAASTKPDLKVAK